MAFSRLGSDSGLPRCRSQFHLGVKRMARGNVTSVWRGSSPIDARSGGVSTCGRYAKTMTIRPQCILADVHMAYGPIPRRLRYAVVEYPTHVMYCALGSGGINSVDRWRLSIQALVSARAQEGAVVQIAGMGDVLR